MMRNKKPQLRLGFEYFFYYCSSGASVEFAGPDEPADAQQSTVTVTQTDGDITTNL